MNNWISVKDKMPRLEGKIILFSNGVVQRETYSLAYDDFAGDFYWHRDELCEDGIFPEIKDDDYWQPLPPPPKK